MLVEPRLRRWAAGVFLLLPALLAACGDANGGIPEGEVFETRGRLTVADRDSGEIVVWDLDVRREVTRYTLASPARLARARSRQITAVIAAQPDASRIDVLGTGVWIWDHVEHFHLYKEPAAIQIDPDLARDAGVTDLVVTGGWVIAFDDARGEANALFERSIGNLRTDIDRTRAPVWRRVETAPHDGFAMVARGQLIASRADGGLDLYDDTATGFAEPTVMEPACPTPTAGTGTGSDVLVSCGDDLLLLRWNDDSDTFDGQRIALPAGAPAPAWLIAEDDLPVFVGDGGPDGVLLADPDADEALWVGLDSPIAAVDVDRDGRFVIVLTASGDLLRLDPVDGTELGRVGVTETPGPLAIGDGFAYVGDATNPAVYEVDLLADRVSGTLNLDMSPGDLIVTALWPGGEPVVH